MEYPPQNFCLIKHQLHQEERCVYYLNNIYLEMQHKASEVMKI